MGKKIFVTYKYSDNDVLKLDGNNFTTARSYVDKLQSLITEDDHINKGENDGEDLSNFKDSTIESKLRDKIYDSSVTIIIVSKNMKEFNTPENEQWIPWEISYSLRERTRNERTTKSNALLAVILPDRNGSYSYYMTENSCPICHSTTYLTNTYFKIMSKNMFNVKKPVYNNCNNHFSTSRVYTGYFSYIFSVKWADFQSDINKYIDIAQSIKDNIDNYDITKQVD